MDSKWSQDLYMRAFRFVSHAHNGQLFPGTDLPYIVHITLVAMEITAALGVESGLNGDLTVQCAILHDTLEDTRVTYKTLKNKFGLPVARGVLALIKDESIRKMNPNRRERKFSR
jgi:(p)ppGpp synthase/HD superfamily hydrolase